MSTEFNNNLRFSRLISAIGHDTFNSLKSIGVCIFLSDAGMNPVIWEFSKCLVLMGIGRIHYHIISPSAKPKFHQNPPIYGADDSFHAFVTWANQYAPKKPNITINSGIISVSSEYKWCYFDGIWNINLIHPRTNYPLITAKISNTLKATIQSYYSPNTEHIIYDLTGEIPAQSFYEIVNDNHIKIEDAVAFSGVSSVIIAGYKFGLDNDRIIGGDIHYIPKSGIIKADTIRKVIPIGESPVNTPAELFNIPLHLERFHGMFAAIGAISAHEVIKISGKYIPAIEPIHIDFSRYLVLQEKANPYPQAFIAGCGAIGCELIKNASIYGTGSHMVRDMDRVSDSNLTRQVLFKESSVGEWKVTEAIRNAKRYQRHPHAIKFKGNKTILNKDTEAKSHTNSDIQSYGIILNALDNIQAREYMDSRSRALGCVLIDSGTLGTKGHVQVCIPRKTSAWCDIRDPPIKETPVCTLTSFPNTFRHCIEWAIAKYGEWQNKTWVNGEEMWNNEFLVPVKTVLSFHPPNDNEFWSMDKMKPTIIAYEELSTGDVKWLSEIYNNTTGWHEFDKDVYDRFDRVYRIAKLRARLYNIPTIDMEEAHTMMGLIVPAMITTTTVVAGLQWMEYLMVASGYESPCDWNINLAINEILYWESSAPRKYSIQEQAIDMGYDETVKRHPQMGETSWDNYIRGTLRDKSVTIWQHIISDLGIAPEDLQAVYDTKGQAIIRTQKFNKEQREIGLELIPVVKDMITPTIVYMNYQIPVAEAEEEAVS